MYLNVLQITANGSYDLELGLFETKNGVTALLCVGRSDISLFFKAFKGSHEFLYNMQFPLTWSLEAKKRLWRNTICFNFFLNYPIEADLLKYFLTVLPI